MNDPSASEQDGFGAIPRAKRVPKERVFHGDTFIDQYEWLRDKQSQDVRDYVAAQNRYCEQRMAPLKSLRKTLFEEFKSHVQETDMSVPTRMDGYWYFTRTMQGRQYATQCRVPIRGADDWDPPTVEAGVPLDGEQVVFDTNVEAEGHDFFRIGGMDISKIDPEKLMSLYAIVFQDVTLFDNTILENIRIGRKRRSLRRQNWRMWTSLRRSFRTSGTATLARTAASCPAVSVSASPLPVHF